MIRLRRILVIVFLLSCAIMTGSAYAEGIKLRKVQMELVDPAWLVNASFQIDLPQELEDALKKGLTFHFVTEFNVSRGRWYWFDEKPIQVQKNMTLSYQPLTQQFKISGGGLTLSSFTLNEALIQMGSIGGWQVAELSALEVGKPYQAEIRMRLDLASLPKPFQINALNAKEWNLSSDRYRFPLTPTLKTSTK
jgi:hypothetical protein